MGPKNGIAAPMHARQSATNTPNPGMTAQEVNPHSVAPSPRSTMKLFIDVMRALTMRIMHSEVRLSSSILLGTRCWDRAVRRAWEGEGRWRESSPTTRTRDNSCCLFSIIVDWSCSLLLFRLYRITIKSYNRNTCAATCYSLNSLWLSLRVSYSVTVVLIDSLLRTLSVFSKCKWFYAREWPVGIDLLLVA